MIRPASDPSVLTVAIDPGEEALAWGLGYGRLEASGLVLGLTPASVGRVVEELRPLLHLQRRDVQAQVAVEFMVHYPKKDPPNVAARKVKDLLDLQFIGGVVAGAVASILPTVRILPVPPRTWNGGFPKAETHARVLPLLESSEVCALDPKRYPTGLRHNLYDMVGIFLYATGRYRAGR